MTTWANNPLAAIVRRIAIGLPARAVHAQDALAWAEQQDREVDRVAAEVSAEARREVAEEMAASELADALEALLLATGFPDGPCPEVPAIETARAALRKAGRLPEEVR